MDTNKLYYGDNLEILRNHIPDSSIDLIYLDPPFNSNATYNVLFKEPGGESSEAQISAFEDAWHWGMESERALQEIAQSETASSEVKEFMSILPKLVGKRTDMSAYLTMMCVRLLELRRVLKDTGSIYLHCDPTASHYLKILMDTIFGANNFRNDIIWNRSTNPKGSQYQSRIYSVFTDNILYFSKTEKAKLSLSQIQSPLSPSEITLKYDRIDEKGPYTDGPILRSKSMGERPNLVYEYNGYLPDASGWRMERDKLKKLDDEGNLGWSATGKPFRKLRPKSDKGTTIGSLWNDISLLNPQAHERLGYPTQKPEALLKRIISASSNEGDIVLYSFCGCGTAIVAAQKLNRKWIGIDITYLAIGLMEWRLKNITPLPKYEVIGEPEDLAGAMALADKDKYQFQWWAVTRAGGQPYGDKKKGADTGIDGYIYYMDEKNKIKKAIISVKGGKTVNVSMIRDLGHVIEREKSDIGIFISLEKPTKPMVEEAAMKGFYNSPLGKDYPRLQILTIEDILHGKQPEIPPWIAPITAPASPKKDKSKTPRLL